MDLVDPAMHDQAPTRTRAKALPHGNTPQTRDYTVTFYVDSIIPSGLPNFPYFINGSAAGRVRVVAYVAADSPEYAHIRVMDFFPAAFVEGIETGRVEQVVPSVQGVSLPERRPGLFRRLFSL
jgi:hypothetical protein